MNTLEDGWRWYQSVRGGLTLAHRVAARYWADLPWEGPLGRDDRFRGGDADAIQADVAFGLEHLDDLAVLVLFSVFEATVRARVLEEVGRQTQGLTHALLQHAMTDLRRGIEEGSFFGVLEAFKTDATPDLVEQVNQVRRYRNWVAHGRRAERPDRVSPQVAYERLARFLAVLRPPG